MKHVELFRSHLIAGPDFSGVLERFIRIAHIIACSLIVVVTANAQMNGTWYFGSGAGIDFSTGTPQPISSPLVALEGTACISDMAGDIMFYSNGASVWDRFSDLMPNGSGIMGGA